MSITTSLIVFDVNETLSDMSSMRARFVEVGAPAHFAEVWFSGLLRDGFALTAAGDTARFGTIGADLLRSVLLGEVLPQNVEEAVSHIMLGLTQLELHSDVAQGVRSLKGAGYRLSTLSNGSAQLAEGLLERSGLRGEFDFLLSVEQAELWKPARAAYEYAGRVSCLRAEELLLVAVHPWDIHGASAAGLQTAWLNRSGTAYPGYFSKPDITIGDLGELAIALGPAGGNA
jgi:2-haloacid dehalogenase